MDVLDMLKNLRQVATLFGAAQISFWAVLVVCLVWLIGKLMECVCDVKIERAKCARDVKVATIQCRGPSASHPDGQQESRCDRHKKNRHG